MAHTPSPRLLGDHRQLLLLPRAPRRRGRRWPGRWRRRRPAPRAAPGRRRRRARSGCDPTTPSQSVRSASSIGAARPVALGPLGRQRDVRRAEQRPGRGQHGGRGLLGAHGAVDVERGLEEAPQPGPVVAGVEVARCPGSAGRAGAAGPRAGTSGSLANSSAAGNGDRRRRRQVTSNLPLIPPETVRRHGVPSVAMIVTMAPVFTTK